MKMSRLRKAARDKPCKVRVSGCDGGGETTVLGHYRLAGECGTSLKPPDLLAAWICGPCHRNTPERSQDLANGVMRTIAALLADGWTFEPPPQNHMNLK